MPKVKVEIEIPDGYELKYPEMRVPKKDKLFLWNAQVNKAHFGFKSDNLQTLYAIVQPITPPWEWPVWLKAPWIAMDEGGDWYAYDDEQYERNGYWHGSTTFWLNDKMFDITLPTVTDWKKSKMKNPRGGE